MASFSSNLKYLRKKLGLTQQDLATALSVSKSSISMYENGSRVPELVTLECIADFFNVDMDNLVGRSYSEVGRAIIEERQEQGITIEELSSKTKIPVKELQLYEQDSQPIKADLLDTIANALGMTKYDLFLKYNIKRPSANSYTFTLEQFSEEELEEIKKFADFIRYRRPKG